MSTSHKHLSGAALKAAERKAAAQNRAPIVGRVDPTKLREAQQAERERAEAQRREREIERKRAQREAKHLAAERNARAHRREERYLQDRGALVVNPFCSPEIRRLKYELGGDRD